MYVYMKGDKIGISENIPKDGVRIGDRGGLEGLLLSDGSKR